jgi:chromosome segregation ATPase
MNNIYPNASLSPQEMNKRMLLYQDELNKTKKALENSETKCEALEWKVNELHETTEKLLQRENASEYMSSNYQHIYELENELENVSNRLIEAENEIQMYKEQFV